METQLIDQHCVGVQKHFVDSDRHTKNWTRADYADAQREGEALDARFVALMDAGTHADDPATLNVVHDHHASIAKFWTPDRASYTALGAMCVDNVEMRARYDSIRAGLAEYLRDALAAYACQHMQ